MLRALSREHEITYLTLDDGTAAPDAVELAREYCSDLETVPFTPSPKGSLSFFWDLGKNLASPLPYAVARYRSPELTAALRRLAVADRCDVLVCDFLAPSVNVPHDGSAGVPTVLFQHNVEAQIWRRHAVVARDPIRQAYFGRQYHRMVAFERAACRRFDRVIAVSEQDAEHFAKEYGASSPGWIPTGVDTEYFRPSGSESEDGHLVFTGSMDWMPNDEGMIWFVESVLPRIREVKSDVRLTVVGRAPSRRLRALAGKHPWVTITGRVPDVRPYLERAAAVVVPLRVGGGTRLKIYEAMAMGKPVVSTTIGAEGLPLTPGRHISLADTVDEMVRACVEVLGNTAYAAGLSSEAARHVRENFAWPRVASRFAELCETTVAASANTRRT